jgi:hypothetical protein
VDHFRYHDKLLPQIIGHTASKNGNIRYSPGSWLRRDYIVIDVGRQHGTGNGGLLLTDFGWVSVTPDGPARLVEVGPLFVTLAHKAASEKGPEEQGEAHFRQMLPAYFRAAKSQRQPLGVTQETLFADLSPGQVIALERFLGTIRQAGRCVIVTDLDEMLTAFSGGDLEHGTIGVLADYLGAGGVLVFNTGAPFDWFYYHLLRPLIVELGPRSRSLANVLLVLSGGNEIYIFQDGAYRLVWRSTGKDKSRGFDALVRLSKARRFSGVPEFDAEKAVYIGDSSAPAGIDPAIVDSVDFVINVGDAMLDMPGESIIKMHRRYLRTIALIVTASSVLIESGRAKVSQSSFDVGDTVLWTFKDQHFPPDRRLRVRVGASGYVHAGVAGPDGTWNPVYNVPLTPLPNGNYEAILPSRVNRFTFFWTEMPWTPDHPGHWESGGRVFKAAAAPSVQESTHPDSLQ